MFLTTSRVETVDLEIQSRIHISLEYKELDWHSRRAIWQRYLRQHDPFQAAARERPPKLLVVSAAKASGPARPRSPMLSASSADEPRTMDEEQRIREQHQKLTLPHSVSEADMDRSAAMPINSRQTKTILKTAQLLAVQRGQALSFEHLDDLLEHTQYLHHVSRERRANHASLFS